MVVCIDYLLLFVRMYFSMICLLVLVERLGFLIVCFVLSGLGFLVTLLLLLL